MADCTKCGVVSELVQEYAEFLHMPEWIVYGAKFSSECSACESTVPWSRITRNHVAKSIKRAIQTLERKLDCKLTPQEKTLLVNPEDCPIQLETPIWYFGKRELIDYHIEPIHWGYKDACNIPYQCIDLNPIGQLVITDIPDEWEGDITHVEFAYPDYYGTPQCLARPTFGYQCCAGEKNDLHRCVEEYTCPDRCQLLNLVSLPTPDTGYCQTFESDCGTTLGFTIGDRVMLWRDDNTFVFAWYSDVDHFSTQIIYDLTQFIAVSIPYIVVTWEKYQLVDPAWDAGKMKETCDVTPDFLNEIQVKFYEIQPGIEIVDVCQCNTCKVCRCGDCETEETCEHETPPVQTLYEYTLDEETGELCLTANHTACSCPEPHRIKLTYGVYPEICEDHKLAIIMRAMLWDTSFIKCSCTEYDEQIEFWQGLEPGINLETFGTVKHYPYGRTRLGVEVLRLLDAITEEKVREGKLHAPSGMFTATTIKKKRPGDRPRYINPREHR